MQHKSPMATLGLLVACLASMTWADALNNNPAERYVNKAPSRDGIGKHYLGREISHVMGHRGASWLERPERQRQERTDLLINNLPLQANSVVADIGAGTGLFQLPSGQTATKGSSACRRHPTRDVSHHCAKTGGRRHKQRRDHPWRSRYTQSDP